MLVFVGARFVVFPQGRHIKGNVKRFGIQQPIYTTLHEDW